MLWPFFKTNGKDATEVAPQIDLKPFYSFPDADNLYEICHLPIYTKYLLRHKSGYQLKITHPPDFYH